MTAKRKATSATSLPAKRKKCRLDEASEDLTHGQSVWEQAEPYRLATAKFHVDALTPAWSTGSNRPLDPKHVQSLSQIFEQQRLQREPVENRLRIACSRTEVERMIAHLETAGELSSATSTAWPSFRDWVSVNGCPAEIMAGQHRVEALKVFLRRKSRLHTSSDEDPQWWLGDIYDRGTALDLGPSSAWAILTCLP